MYANCKPEHNKNLREIPVDENTYYNARNPHPSIVPKLCAFCGEIKDNPRAAFCSLLCKEWAEIKEDFKNLWFNPDVKLEDFPDDPVKKF